MDDICPRVVFDCNVLFQALISPLRPSRRCVEIAGLGRAHLFVSQFLYEEFIDVTERPGVRQKFHLDSNQVAEFLDRLRAFAVFVDVVPEVFAYGRDRDDAHYINLALAADTRLVVSRDNDLFGLGRHKPGRRARVSNSIPES